MSDNGFERGILFATLLFVLLFLIMRDFAWPQSETTQTEIPEPVSIETVQDGDKTKLVKIFHLPPETDPQLVMENFDIQNDNYYHLESTEIDRTALAPDVVCTLRYTTESIRKFIFARFVPFLLIALDLIICVIILEILVYFRGVAHEDALHVYLERSGIKNDWRKYDGYRI